VKTEHLGSLCRELVLDVLTVSLAVELERVGALEAWRASELHAVEDLGTNKDLQVGVVRATIPVVCDVTSVHDLTVDVAEIIIGNLLVLGKVIVKHITADLKITIVEVVVTRPALATELLSTQDEGVEHAEPEEERLELAHLVGQGALEMRLIELVESTTDVSLEVLRSLVSNLDGVLEDGLGNGFHLRQWGRL
jgi:hypothetical protein